MKRPEEEPQNSVQLGEQSMPAGKAAVITEQDRIVHGVRWDRGLEQLQDGGGYEFNIAKLLSDGVKSGLPLEIACSIALSTSSVVHSDLIHKTLRALTTFNNKPSNTTDIQPE